MIRKALWSASASLGLFHVWIFGRQLWNGELSDVTVLGRWLLAAGLVWSLIALRRQGASLFWGRKAVAIWVLATLLHGPAVMRLPSAPEAPALPDIVVMLVQATMSGAMLLGLALVFFLTTARTRPRLALRAGCESASIGSLAFRASLGYAPRPPPIA